MFAGPYGHTIKQYSSSGKLLQVLGTAGKSGSGLNPLQFDQPADIFIHDSTKEIYIVDGDGGMNNRLIKLSQGFNMNNNNNLIYCVLGMFIVFKV